MRRKGAITKLCTLPQLALAVQGGGDGTTLRMYSPAHKPRSLLGSKGRVIFSVYKNANKR